MLYDRSKKLTEEQRTAYRNTRYEARLKNETAIIRVGMHCQILDSLCEEHAVSSWAFITACNPQSQELTDADNQHCLLYTSPSPRDATLSRMPSSA